MSRPEDLSDLPVALSGSFVPPRLFPSVLIASHPLKVFLKDGSDGFLPVEGEDLAWSAAVPHLLSPPAHPVLRAPLANRVPRWPPLLFPQCGGRTARRAYVTALLDLRCAASVKSGLNLFIQTPSQAGLFSRICFPFVFSFNIV